jgi:hypothetical protein
MKLLPALVLSLVLVAFASDPPKPDPALAAAQQETRLAKLEALILRETLAAQQLDKVRADQQALFVETCKAAGIEPDPKICIVDLNAKTVTRRAPEAAAPAKK